MYSNLVLFHNKKTQYQQYYLYYICFMFIFFIISITLFYTRIPNCSEPIEIFDVYKSTYISSNETLILNIHNHKIHHIYIDIGCFNGETIEHFIHFTPNSIFYDIITFEPDPINYRLCKQRLTQKKYSNYNIIIIPKVVWIRNEKVFYQTNCGQRCRIESKKTNQTNLNQLDAIDFSSWLYRLIKTTNKIKLHIRLSMPGAEVLILRKMLVDGTFELPDQWTIEWSDRSDRRKHPARFYVQSMFDALGYDFLYLTILSNIRQIFHINGSYANVTKYRSWDTMKQPDTYFHYIQRPDIPES